MAQFGTGWLPPLVQTTRANKVALIQETRQPIEGIILGSSRVLKLEPEYLAELTGKRFLNLGVNHCRAEDLLAILRFFQQARGELPRIVVLGIDPAMFDDFSPPDSRLVANRHLRPKVPEMLGATDRLSLFSGMFSYQMSKASLGSLHRCWQKTNESPIESFATDGTIIYHQRESQRQAGTYDFAAALEYNRKEYSQLFRQFKQLSAKRWGLLLKTLGMLRQNDSQVFMFLTPTHPDLDLELGKTPHYRDRLAEIDQLLTMTAARFGVKYVNFNDIRSFEGDPSQFVDGIHPLERNTRRIIQRLFSFSGEVPQYAFQ
jgi:hypothetical protein